MIAVDTSSLSAYLNGEKGHDIDLLDESLSTKSLQLPPAVVTEALSAPHMSVEGEAFIACLPLLDLTFGHWARSGKSRRLLLSKGLRARLGNALIAQACIDNDAALITRDSDFRHYATHCGLKLA